MCLHSLQLKPRWTCGRIWEELSKNTFQGFHLLKNPQALPILMFSPGYEDKENMFYFFYKIIAFCRNKEIDDNYKKHVYMHVYLNFFLQTVNFHILETANHIAHVIFVLHRTENTLVNKSKHTHYQNYFIIY